MTLTRLFAAVALLLSSQHVGSASTTTPESERPNILLILTDDQGWPTLGCYGGDIVPTPHLDRLAADGARFTDAWVTSQCTPTRATLLTGQYTARHRLWHVLSWYGYPWARMTEPPFSENYARDTFTIARALRAAGYTTGIMGKWHLTSNADGSYMGLTPAAATHYGFDFAPPVLSRDEFQPGADRGVDTLTTQAVEFIRRHQDGPWFCFLSHHMIHGVVVAPEELVAEYRRRGFADDGPNRAVYLAGLEHIDRSIGRLMSALDEMDEARETVVIFLSDNGGIDERYAFQNLQKPHPPRPRLTPDLQEYDNAPLRAGKGSIYEGGIRVPMIVRWPDRVPRGLVIRTPVHAIDILPTAIDLAGAAAPPDHALDGQSLRTLITTGEDPRLTHRPLFQYCPFYDLRWGLTPCAAVRQGDEKLIEFFGDRVTADGHYTPGHRIELYNLRDDIGETRNLAESNPTRATQLRQTLHDWMDSLAAAPSVPNPHHDDARAFQETRTKPDWLAHRAAAPDVLATVMTDPDDRATFRWLLRRAGATPEVHRQRDRVEWIGFQGQSRYTCGLFLDEQGRVVKALFNKQAIDYDELQQLAGFRFLRHINCQHNFGRDKGGPNAAPGQQNNVLSGAGWVAFRNHPLEFLRLAGSPFDGDGLRAVAQITSLRTLDIFHTAVTDADLVALRGHPSLEEVIVGPMWDDRITNKAMEHISQIPNLKRVKVVETFLSWDRGLEHLAQRGDRMETIDLGNTVIPIADLERLRQELPGATIRHEPVAKIGELILSNWKGADRKLRRWAPPEVIDAYVAAARQAAE